MSEFGDVAPVANDSAPQTDDSAPLSPREAASAYARRRSESAQNSGEARDTREPANEIGREADAAPETAHGEDEGIDPPRKAPIEPPKSWTKEQRDLWSRIDPDVQETISAREAEREADTRRRHNEVAEQRKAIEAERRAVEQQRSQYDQALPVLIQTLQAQQAGEFADIKTWQDVHRMQQEDPYRYGRWDLLNRQAQQAQAHYTAQQQQRQQEGAKRFEHWTAEQDKAFSEYATEFKDPKALDKARTEVRSYLVDDVGIPEQALLKMWGDPNGVLHIRDAKVQRVIRDAAKWRAAEKAAKDTRAKPLPPVQRPGTSEGRGERGASNIQALQQKLERSGDLKDAAALYAARRASNARRG